MITISSFAMFWALQFSHAQVNAPFSETSMALLKEIVEINSATENKEGLAKFREKITPAFKELGFQSRLLAAPDGRQILVFDFPDAEPKVLLVGHLDTIFEKSEEPEKLMANAEFISGPGVADMKGGVVMMLEILKAQKDRQKLKGVRIVLNDDEEAGSTSSIPQMRELAEKIPNILIFEPSPAGEVVTSHAGLMWVELNVVGKAAHSGDDPKSGINACVELSRKISAIAKLNDPVKRVLVNPIFMSGGTKTNTVCPEAKATVEIRYVNFQDKERILRAVEEIVRNVYDMNRTLKQGAITKMNLVVEKNSLPEEFTKALGKKYLAIAKEKNIKMKGAYAAGVTSFGLASPRAKILNGLGPAQTGSHSSDEKLLIRATLDKLQVGTALVEELLL